MDQSAAVPYGLMVMHAMDLYNRGTCPPHAVAPAPPPGGGEIIAWVMGDDTILPGHPDFQKGPLTTFESRVCYGYVAREGNELVVAIRGTNGIAEWIEDAEFAPLAWPRDGACRVEQGFWGIYDTFELVDMNLGSLGKIPAALPGLMGGAASVMVTGHSLGAPLATYLAFDLAGQAALAGKVRLLCFASPHPGDQAFANRTGAAIPDHTVYNYVLDVVPRVPALLGYVSLPKVTYIQPSSAKAKVTFSLGCDHHIVCYCAMLDYQATKPVLDAPPPEEKECAACVKGPADGSPSIAESIVARIASVL